MKRQWLISGRRVRSPIKSVQYGSITVANSTTSNTATINSVDVSNSYVVFLGSSNTNATYVSSSSAIAVVLTNATTVTADRVSNSGAVVCKFVVMEFWPCVLKSVQTGTISLSGTTSNTATITTVDINTSFVVPGGSRNDYAGGSGETDILFPTLTLTDSVTVTGAVGANNASANIALPFTVVEFL